jgi:hypothetical protein
MIASSDHVPAPLRGRTSTVRGGGGALASRGPRPPRTDAPDAKMCRRGGSNGRVKNKCRDSVSCFSGNKCKNIHDTRPETERNVWRKCMMIRIVFALESESYCLGCISDHRAPDAPDCAARSATTRSKSSAARCAARARAGAPMARAPTGNRAALRRTNGARACSSGAARPGRPLAEWRHRCRCSQAKLKCE